MKLWLVTLLLVGAGTGAIGQGAQADQIKRRARALADENNAGQAVPPTPVAPVVGSRSANPPAPAAPTALSPTTAQKNLAALRSQLMALSATNSPDHRHRLVQNLQAIARQPAQPSAAAWQQLGEDLAAGLSGTKLAATQWDRLAQQLEVIVGSPTGTSFDTALNEVQSLLTKAGTSAPRVALITGDLRRIASAASPAATPAR